MPSVEFHNELYGYLKEVSGKDSIIGFDNYLKQDKKISDTKKYLRDGAESEITLCTYIRHQIDHPDNRENKKYTGEEFKRSTEILIKAINP